jgi:hypothetical protein
VHTHVGDGCGRQILRERLPVAAAVERHERAELGARIEQAFARGIFAHDAGGMIEGNAVLAVGQ